MIRPYNRSWRLVAALCLAAILFLPLYHNTMLSERPYYKEVMIPGIRSFFGGMVYNNTLYGPGNQDEVHQRWNFSNPCTGFPDTDGILLVMKTGATEAFDKMPTQLLTSLQCLPDFLLFSDLEQQIGQHHVYDALEGVSDSIKSNNPEFDLYQNQQECAVSQKECNSAREMGSAGWDLDKYKFLNIIERTWRMRPGKDWYVFAEADTYVFWPNLVTWLRSKQDPQEKLYLGSVTMINGFPFAHGGSGYVISGVLLKSLIENNPGLPDAYGQQAKEVCCGDLLIGFAIKDKEGVEMANAHPMFNGEKPITLPFGPGHWCEPIFTAHHMNSEEISAVWQYEQTRKERGIILMKDLYNTFVAPKMVAAREDWDNLSDDVCYGDPSPEVQMRMDPTLRGRQKPSEELNDVEKEAHLSPDHCARVCSYEDDENEAASVGEGSEAIRMQSPQKRQLVEERQCFQHRYHEGVCCTSKSFKLGAPKTVGAPEEEKWYSGWYLKGIEDWISAAGECGEPFWINPYSIPVEEPYV